MDLNLPSKEASCCQVGPSVSAFHILRTSFHVIATGYLSRSE